MITEEIVVEEEPELRYTRTGLSMCTLHYCGSRYVAFEVVAEEIAAIAEVGDVLRVTGYWKEFSWVDSEGESRSREDFTIRYGEESYERGPIE